MRKVFDQTGAFEACNAAERWCEANGISVGHAEGAKPRGLLFGDFDIQKWHNLNAAERTALHGTMEGNMRHGPVTIKLKDGPVREHKPELLDAP